MGCKYPVRPVGRMRSDQSDFRRMLAPPKFTCLGEHLSDNFYNPKTLAICLKAYLDHPDNAMSDDDIADMHHVYNYRERIEQFLEILVPFIENPD